MTQHHRLLVIDLAKTVFQVAAFDDNRNLMFNRSYRRDAFVKLLDKQSPTTIVMEACYSSHYWGRQLLAKGHTVKLIPAKHVTPPLLFAATKVTRMMR